MYKRRHSTTKTWTRRTWLPLWVACLGWLVVGCGGLSAPGLPCQSQQDCTQGQVCTQGTCHNEQTAKRPKDPNVTSQTPCQQTADCSNQATCVAGRCQATSTPTQSSGCFPSRFQAGVQHTTLHRTNDLSVSNDGTFLATAHDELLKVWSVKLSSPTPPELQQVLYSKGEAFEKIQQSPDKKQLASFSKEGIKLWDLKRGRVVHQWVPRSYVLGMTFNAEGTSFVAVTEKQVTRWQLPSGKVSHALSFPPLPSGASVRHVNLTPYGKYAIRILTLKTNHPSNTQWQIQVIHTQTGSVDYNFSTPEHRDSIQSVALTEDAKELRMTVRRLWSRFLLVWDLSQQKIVGTHKLPSSDTKEAMILHPRGSHVAFANSEQNQQSAPYKPFSVWSLERGRAIVQGRVFHVPQASIQTIVYSPNGSHLGVALDNGAIAVVDAKDSTSPTAYSSPWNTTSTLQELHFNPQGTELFTLSSDGFQHQWDLTTNERLGVLFHHRNVRYLRTDAAKTRAVVLFNDNKTLEVWNLQTGEKQKLPEPPGFVFAIAISAQGGHISIFVNDRPGNSEGLLQVWTVADQKLVSSRSLPKPSEGPWLRDALSFSPDGTTLAFLGYANQPVMFWNFKTNTTKTLKLLIPPFATRGRVKYSTDGKYLGVAAENNSYVVHIPSLKPRFATETHNGIVSDMTFSPEGQWFATTSTGDGMVRIWDTQSGKLHGTLMTTQEDSLVRVAFHPNGKSLAYMSSKGQVSLWRCP
ncbi:MAG: hypothetical protein EP343_29195 [Deltaproteobacteria bacterium]|nr:MAG: hypothetical protein EP343_29195 [Deltaproteobacteria bacterium]